MNRVSQFLKTTAIGGLLFLLPLVVIGALIGQVVPIILTVAEVLGDIIPFKSPGGIALLILLAFIAVLLLCFGAGLLARRSLGKRMYPDQEPQSRTSRGRIMPDHFNVSRTAKAP